jgi:hypothetical protein
MAQKPAQEYYQITVYHYANSAQEQSIDQYLEKALLPALHKQGTRQVGVFKNIGNDTAAYKTLYVLTPAKSPSDLAKSTEALYKDDAFLKAGAAYLNALHDNPPYARMETIYLKAFSHAPLMQTPALKGPRNERVYELRSYESATEKIYRNKVHMFNEGKEIELFKRLNFNAIFYGDVIAGSKMPNLMYMTSFENMADREAHWKAFVDDPQWKDLSTRPEYQNNVSHIDVFFLRPTAYSDF